MSVTVEKEFIRELPKATAKMSGTLREVSVSFSSEVFCTPRLVGQKLVAKLLALQVESKKFVEYVVLETETKEWEKFIPFLAATNKVDGLDYFIALIPGNENFLPDSAGRKIIVKYTTGHYDFIDRPTSELVIDSERLREFEIDNLTYTTSSSAQPESPANS